MNTTMRKLQLVLIDCWPTGLDGFTASHEGGGMFLADYDEKMKNAVTKFQQSQQLETTGTMDSVTEGRLNSVAEKANRYVVYGTVTDHKSEPISSIDILAEDIDLRSKQQLGIAITNAKGEYIIFYDHSDFDRYEKGSADLKVTASKPQSNEAVASQIHFNVPHVFEVNLQIEEQETESEYCRYMKCLNPVLGNVSAHELTDEEICFCHGETDISFCHLKFIQIDATYQQELDLPLAMSYAWLRQGLPAAKEHLFALDADRLRDALKKSIAQNIVDAELESKLEEALNLAAEYIRPKKQEAINFEEYAHLTPIEIKAQDEKLYQQLVRIAQLHVSDLLRNKFMGSKEDLQHFINTLDVSTLDDGEESIEALLERAIEKSCLPSSVKNQAGQFLDGIEESVSIQQALQKNTALVSNPVFSGYLSDAKSFYVGEVSGLTEPEIDSLIAKGIRTDNISRDKMDELICEQLLSEEKVHAFGVNSNLLQISDNNLDLFRVLKPHAMKGNEPALRGLALNLPNKTDWIDVIENAQIQPPAELDTASYGANLHKQIETLYPNDIIRLQFESLDNNENEFKEALSKISPFLEKMDVTFEEQNVNDLDLDAFEENERLEFIAAYQVVKTIGATYPGLELREVIRDPALSNEEKYQEAARRVRLLTDFQNNYPDANYLSLDLTNSENNEELVALGLEYPPIDSSASIAPNSDQAELDKGYVRNYLASLQSIYHMAGSTEVLYTAFSAGYSNQLDMAGTNPEVFSTSMNMTMDESRHMRVSANNSVMSAGLNFGLTLEHSGDSLIGAWSTWIPWINTSPTVDQVLRELERNSDLFNSQSYCKCAHCQSIYSPAAYFVDLMDYIDTNIQNVHFATRYPSDDVRHYINLKIRRPDLWDGIPLTCECTTTLIPYLEIINEVLENYLGGSKSDAEKRNRRLFESRIYKQIIYNEEVINTINQPFNLATFSLDAYLEYFPMTRARVAKTFFAYQDNKAPEIAHAEIRVSTAEASVIANPPATLMLRSDSIDFYGFDEATRPKPESIKLTRALEITRDELTQLVATKFVKPFFSLGTFSFDPIFVNERRDGDPDLQPDMEVVNGLTNEALDRMHRFIRLWKKLDWTIAELDLVLHHDLQRLIKNRGTATPVDDVERATIRLTEVVGYYTFANKWGFSVPQLCSLIDKIPIEGTDSLFQKLFNQVDFQSVETVPAVDPWASPNTLTERFLHPAHTTSSDTSLSGDDIANSNLQHRLLAGLNLDEDSLYQLIKRLAPSNLLPPLAMSAAGDFELDHDSLTVLYVHALVTQKFSLAIDEMFSLIELSPEIDDHFLHGWDDLVTLVDTINWQRESGFSTSELEFVLSTDRLDEFDDMLELIVNNISTNGTLQFANTILAFSEGVTENQSIELFELAENQTLFEKLPGTNLVRLTSQYHLAADITLPDEFPLLPDGVHEIISAYSAPEIFALELGNALGTTKSKVKNLAKLCRSDFNSADVSRRISTAIHSNTTSPYLARLTHSLNKLNTCFKADVFDDAALQFVLDHSGDSTNIFHANHVDYRSLSMQTLKQIALFRTLLPKDEARKQSMLDVIDRFEHDSLRRFSVDAEAKSEVAFAAEKGLINSLNRLITFPGTAGPTPTNQALQAADKLKQCIKLAQYFGVGGEALPLIVSQDFDEQTSAVSILNTAIRTKHETQAAYEEDLEPFKDRIREARRDALTEYLLHSFEPIGPLSSEVFKRKSDLYHYFLLDTELEGCARTSKVVAGISSLQLYIQRVIMNLEQTPLDVTPPLHVTLTPEVARQWEWRKNYRVWEANRKVFLYPENYIEPDLRDNKTPLFNEFESNLLQQEIKPESVLEAYTKYMDGFSTIAGLKIAGAYHDFSTGKDVLHLFGVTSDQPPVHYYRTIENINYTSRGVKWNPWLKLDMQIPVEKVSPIVYRGRLYVFWVQIVTKPLTKAADGSSMFAGYTHTRSLHFTYMKLDDTWAPPQTLGARENESGDNWMTVEDRLWDATRFKNFIQITSRTIARKESDGSWPVVADQRKFQHDNFLKIHSGISSTLAKTGQVNEVQKFFFKIDGKTYQITILFGDHIVFNLFVPKHGGPINKNTWDDDRRISDLHLEAKDGYTLTGDLWTRPFPYFDKNGKLIVSLYNGEDDPDFRVDIGVDLFSKREFNDGELTEFRYIVLYRQDDKINASGITVENPYFSENVHSYPNFYQTHEEIEGLRGPELLENGPEDLYKQPELFFTNKRRFSSEVFLEYPIHSADNSKDVLFLSNRGARHNLNRIGTTLADKLSRTLFENGIEGFLNIEFQEGELKEASLPVVLSSRVQNAVAGYERNDAGELEYVGKMDTTGSLGVYFRELFFHNPYLIANHLNSQGKYADAQQWYHYIFNPLHNDPPAAERDDRNRVWQYVEFRDHGIGTLRNLLDDRGAVEVYENDPFNPHAIARLRLGAYKRNIFMKYIDNLLDWGDHLFAQDSMESINEATLLYIMASDLLGERPHEIGDCDEPDDAASTYNHLIAGKRPAYFAGGAFSDFRNDLMPSIADEIYAELGRFGGITGENIGAGIGTGIGTGTSATVDDASPAETPTAEQPNDTVTAFMTSLMKQAKMFCVPVNPDLLAYWDRVADRLYKIHNCMNIRGITRELPLFAPEIDPRLLVGAKAKGISINEVLNTISGNLPPYRFNYLIAKAKETTAALQSFGGALLSALEKADGEELAALKLRHETNLLKLTTRQKLMEVKAAEGQIESLNLRKATVSQRLEYFDGLLSEGLTGLERAKDDLYYIGQGLKALGIPFAAVAGTLSLVPSIVGFSFSTPTEGAVKSLGYAAQVLGITGGASIEASSIVGKYADYERRVQGWEHSKKQSESELSEIEKQIEIAEIRKEIVVRSMKLHEESINNLEEIFEFNRDKFTNAGLYTWLSRQLQLLFREAYQSALYFARLAEQAYRFERIGDSSSFLSGEYWDAGHVGLYAGEKLMGDLRNMERSYMETHYREMEIDQAFSLTQINPKAIIDLKETGECSFKIPEFYFDLFYPGQYRRRIKSARLTIPCVTGPYTNVSATLSLVSSQIRKEPDKDETPVDVPPMRTVTIATSTAQNDSGVFNLDFRDERYMPFEGAGAIESDWNLKLPKSFKPFDYSTINDVILHISYSAHYNDNLRSDLEGELENLEDIIKTKTMHRVFSFRQEFSDNFHSLLTSPVGSSTSIKISEIHFPLFLQGKTLSISAAKLVLDLENVPDDPELTLTVSRDGETQRIENGFSEDKELGGLLSNSISSDIYSPSIAPHESATELVFTIINSGNLGPGDVDDDSALDSNNVKDIYLYFEFGIA